MVTWLEITDRTDLGVNLKAPQFDDAGRRYWSYTLVTNVHESDIACTITVQRKRSLLHRACQEQCGKMLSFGVARGASARGAGRIAHTRPGWYVGLEEFSMLPSPIM